MAAAVPTSCCKPFTRCCSAAFGCWRCCRHECLHPGKYFDCTCQLDRYHLTVQAQSAAACHYKAISCSSHCFSQRAKEAQQEQCLTIQTYMMQEAFMRSYAAQHVQQQQPYFVPCTAVQSRVFMLLTPVKLPHSITLCWHTSGQQLIFAPDLVYLMPY